MALTALYGSYGSYGSLWRWEAQLDIFVRFVNENIIVTIDNDYS